MFNISCEKLYDYGHIHVTLLILKLKFSEPVVLHVQCIKMMLALVLTCASTQSTNGNKCDVDRQGQRLCYNQQTIMTKVKVTEKKNAFKSQQLSQYWW